MPTSSDEINSSPNEIGGRPVGEQYQAILIRDNEVPKMAVYNAENVDAWIESTICFNLEGMR